ncbi:MAG: ribonuclease III [Pacificimonas sp.]
MTTDLKSWAKDALGHDFHELQLLENALTHGSGKRAGGGDYERLEFLGDRVLGLVIAEWLYEAFDESEGDMNRRFASLVDKQSCADVAAEIGASAHIQLESAARASGVHRSANLLGDVCEALIAALYLDGGMAAANSFIRKGWADRIDTASKPPRNPKNQLQEWAQGQRKPIPNYDIVWRDGPDHAPKFRVEVTVRGLHPISGEGASRQEAEKAAALALLKRENAL